MTIASTISRVSFVGNGVTTAFSYPYYFGAASDLTVIDTLTADGTQTTKALTTDYTIAGTPDANGVYESGGTINAVTAPSNGHVWTIFRSPAQTQGTAFVDNDSLPAASIEDALDKLTALVQRISDLGNRSLRLTDGDTALPMTLPSAVGRANSYLAFDASGNPIASTGTTTPNPFSAALTTFAASATTAAAVTALGAVPADSRATIASAATVAIGAATASYLQVTGTTTITAFDTATAGLERTLEFAGILTLTNSSAIILPGGANITTAAGDTAIFKSEGAGNWRCVEYSPAAAVANVGSFTNMSGTVDRFGRVIAASSGTPAFTKTPYVSAQQTITAAGALTLAHGLGVQPNLVQLKLHCLTAENGYSIGDEIQINTGVVGNSSNSQGCAVIADGTNVNVRFGSDTTTFIYLHKTTGAAANLTNANWAAIFMAWA